MIEFPFYVARTIFEVFNFIFHHMKMGFAGMLIAGMAGLFIFTSFIAGIILVPAKLLILLGGAVAMEIDTGSPVEINRAGWNAGFAGIFEYLGARFRLLAKVITHEPA
jgi:hypothetical protein